MAQAIAEESALREFKSGFRGPVLRPGDEGYDSAREVFNGMIDRRPGLIVRPADTADVQRAVRFGAEHRLLVSVKGGGHSVPGYGVCDDGLTIDLSLMNGITVDAAARVATAQGGVTWGEFDPATQAHGLAVTGGRVPSTGIGGLTLGSGSGWLERKLGYTADNLIGAEVVTADGRVLTANANENADLFWGLRGGGGNFGVVTSFQFRLHPIGPTVFGGLLGYTRDRAVELFRLYRDFMEGAPDEIGSALVLGTAPPEPFVPEHMRGQPAIVMVICYSGDPERGEEAIRPLLDFGPVLKMVQPMPYVAVQRLIEPMNPPGLQNYWTADMYPELPDSAIDAAVAAASQPISPHTAILFQPLGGAIARVGDGATALGWRGAKWALHALGMWQEPADNERQIAWVRGVANSLKPYAQKGVYLNYIGDEGEERVRTSFGTHYQRMVDLKRKYDPTNLFRMNQNIKPSTNGSR